MKIFGIIAEYNPFHNGHKRQLDFCRSCGADLIFCAMSGEFTQRGEPAVLEKRIRAKHAIQSGADLVAELPVPYAVSGARDFAMGGVRLLEKLGCTHICFGSEQGELEHLENAAKLICSREFNRALKLNLKNGCSYPASAGLAGEKTGEIMRSPNNILAIEYLRALSDTNSKMLPVTLKRNADYASDRLELNKEVASASAIRSNLFSEEIKSFMPECASEDIFRSGKNLTAEYGSFAHAFLALCSKEYLNGIEGITEGLENRIARAAAQKDFDGFFNALKTKRYTSSRLKRVLFNSVFGITKELAEQSRNISPPVMLLAAKKDCKALKSLKPCGLNNENDFCTRINALTLATERLFCALRQIPFSTLKKLEKF